MLGTDGARADVSSLGFWNPLSQAFFDIRLVNPLAETSWKKDSSVMYKDHEKSKKKSTMIEFWKLKRVHSLH